MKRVRYYRSCQYATEGAIYALLPNGSFIYWSKLDSEWTSPCSGNYEPVFEDRNYEPVFLYQIRADNPGIKAYKPTDTVT